MSIRTAAATLIAVSTLYAAGAQAQPPVSTQNVWHAARP